MSTRAEHILLVLVAGIGDFVMATPAIRAIRRGSPKARIAFLTTPQAAGLAQPCPFFEKLFTFDLRAFRPEQRGTGLRGGRRLWELARELRSQHFDLAINLYQMASLGGAIRMSLFFAAIGAGRTAGRWSGGLGASFGIRSPDHPHQLDAMLRLAASLGCPAEDKLPELWIPQISQRSATQRLHEIGLGGEDPFAVLNFSSNRPEARLPQSKAVEIGRRIHQATGLPVLLSGDESEARLAQALCAAIGPAGRTLAGRIGLLELAAILSRAKVVVSTDSGPMHIAAAVGAPLVALFGPADPAHTSPRGQTGTVAILQGKARPRTPKKWHLDLAVDEVIEAALQHLAAPSPARTV